MTADELRRMIVDSLARVAPEIRSASIDPRVSLRDQFDIDSMDFLNFIVALHERLGIAIPEADYGKLLTLDSATAYLAAALTARPAPPS